MAKSMEDLVKRGEQIVDNVSGMVQELKLSEVHVDLDKGKALLEQLPKWQAIGEQILRSRLTKEGLPKAIEAGESLVDSGMLDEDAVETIGRIGRQAIDSYLKASKQPVQHVGGLWGVIRASKDPDVQKSIGFAFAFAKEFGKNLK